MSNPVSHTQWPGVLDPYAIEYACMAVSEEKGVVISCLQNYSGHMCEKWPPSSNIRLDDNLG